MFQATVLLLAVGVAHFASCAPPETLRMVNMLYRHGDRSPSMVYPTDINPASTWPDGFSWLTNLGKEQQFELGQFIRQRYGGFLNVTRYQSDQIHIESSASVRCLMSAYSNLAGLFPPQGDQIWRRDLPWQPIPVQTRPLHEDNKLAQMVPCPRVKQLVKEFGNSPYIKNRDKENKEFYEMVSHATGFNWTSMMDICRLSNLLNIEKLHNLTWNDWAYQPGVWDRLYHICTDVCSRLFMSSEMAKLLGGPLLSEVISNMEAARTQKPISPKVYMYSGHDNTVVTLLRVMDVYNWLLPLFSSTVFVELHEIDGDYKVKIFYRNDTTVEPYELVPEGCGNECSLESFIDMTKKYIPIEFKAECEEHPSSSSSSISKDLWIVIGVGAGVSVLVTIFVATGFACRHGKTVRYCQLDLQ